MLHRFWSIRHFENNKDVEFLASLPKEFKQAIKKKYYDSNADIIRAVYCSNNYITQKIIQFPFRYKWAEIINNDEMYWQEKFFLFYWCVPHLTKIKTKMIEWYRTKVLQKGDIIIRDRKNNKLDIRMTIQYHPRKDEYFNTAFSGIFKKDMEDGAFVIHTRREGTTQEVVQLYWRDYRKNKEKGRQNVFEYIDNHKTTLDELKETIQSILVIADKWGDECFGEIVSEYLMRYMNNTIYNRNKTSIKRIVDFIQNDNVLVEYIWQSNFNTEKSRFALAYELKISKRDEKGFIKSQTIAELNEYVNRKTNQNKNMYDNLPDYIWKEIKKTEEEYAIAKCGIRVGMYSRYYSSEEIDAAYQRHKQAWIKADRWIGKQNAKNGIKMNEIK